MRRSDPRTARTAPATMCLLFQGTPGALSTPPPKKKKNKRKQQNAKNKRKKKEEERDSPCQFSPNGVCFGRDSACLVWLTFRMFRPNLATWLAPHNELSVPIWFPLNFPKRVPSKQAHPMLSHLRHSLKALSVALEP